jgi:hypothetical protein
MEIWVLKQMETHKVQTLQNSVSCWLFIYWCLIKLSWIWIPSPTRIWCSISNQVKWNHGDAKQETIERGKTKGIAYVRWLASGRWRRWHMHICMHLHFHLQHLAPYVPPLHHKALLINIPRTNHNEDGSRKHIVLGSMHTFVCRHGLSSPCHAHGYVQQQRY